MEQKNIIVITDQNPYLVKDGITAANNSLIRSLKDFEFDLIVKSENNFYNVCNGQALINNGGVPVLDSYKNIIVGSLNIFKSLSLKNKNIIIQLSDCYTYALYKNVSLSLKFGWFDFKSLLKIPFIYIEEKLIAKKSSCLLMQTEKDVAILKKLKISKNSISLPNVPEITVEKFTGDSILDNTIGWCATFKGTYLKVAKYFFIKVLEPFLKEHKKVSIHLAGGGANEFSDWITSRDQNSSEQVYSYNYIEEISNFYQSKTVNICPIFKGYGLINKVVEAMFSGALVIGDSAAFNGINVENNKSVLIASNFDEWKSLLKNIMSKDLKKINLEIRRNAQKTISNQLNIDNNHNKIKSILI